MQQVPIYYETDDLDEEFCVKHFTLRKDPKKDDGHWHPEPRFMNTASMEVPEDQWVSLFPNEDYGDYENDFREVEKRYNIDRMQFNSLNYDAPEIIPVAEQFEDTLIELMTAAKLIFDKIGKTDEMRTWSLALMNRVSKDCYILEDAVSSHMKVMTEQYPDDDVLHTDLQEIDSDFLEFYVDIFNTIRRYQKKRDQRLAEA